MSAIKNVEILEILGDKFVEGLVYKDIKTGEQKELKVSGILWKSARFRIRIL